MNYNGAGIIDAVMLAAIRADVASITGDAQVSTTVTVDTPTSAPTIDYATGTSTPTVASATVSALLGTETAEETRDDEGVRTTLRRTAYIEAALLSTRPNADSTVLIGSDRYGVTLVAVDAFTAHYQLALERVA